MNKLLPYKYLTPLAMFYISIMICADLLVNKPIQMPFGHTTAATFIFPIWFVLNDIIAEVYGYKTCRTILWTGFFIQFIFNSLCYVAINLPSPTSWANQSAFDLLLGDLFRIALGTLAAYLIGGYINIYLITKWKAIMSGRHFWLRSIGSSTIGEAFYSGLNVWVILLGLMPLSEIWAIMFWSYLLKVVYTIILAYPAMILVQILKNKEDIDIYDLDEKNFNPFRAHKINISGNAP